MVSISSLMAFTPLIIAKFVTNAHIFSPLNMSFITILQLLLHYNYQNYSHYKYKNIEC